jgi:hypothetical protein
MADVTLEYQYGGTNRVTYFSDEVPASDAVRLAAAVVWRGTPAPTRGWREWWRRLKHRLGPLGLGFHLKGSVPDWAGTAGEHGEQETLYSRYRRVVRVLGKDYALPPDDRTLILLIDEAGSPDGPIVTSHLLSVPPLPRSQQGESDAPPGQSVWAAFLRRDPEVSAFMAGRPAIGTTSQ